MLTSSVSLNVVGCTCGILVGSWRVAVLPGLFEGFRLSYFAFCMLRFVNVKIQRTPGE